MKKWMWYLWAGLAAMVSLAQPAMATTYYVPDNYATIQAAVDACRGGETIVVRAGTYKGAGNKNITVSKIVDIIAESGPEATIIDCEGSGRGFYFKNVSSLNELEGFQIINGSVTGSGLIGQGGGILLDYASPIIRNCIITGNSASTSGGGIYATGSPTLSDCRINNNAAKGGNGGGIYSSGGVLSITNCEINNNTAAASYGGGIYSTGSGFLLTGSQINGNVASYGGGGIYRSGTGGSITNCALIGNIAQQATNGGGGILYQSSNTSPAPAITNCTFAFNQAPYGGGFMTNAHSTWNYRPVISNCIFYWDSGLQEIDGGVTVTYSNVMGGFSGDGNIDANPQFATDGDYHLAENSPCIDTANPDVAPGTDLDGELRPVGNGYDMGADEFAGESVPPPTPCKADLNDDGVVDGLDLVIFSAEYGRTDCCKK